MKASKNEIIFIYNSGNIQDRKALAYVISLKRRKVKAFDVQHNSLTETQLKSIANSMEVPPEELLDKHSTKYLKYFVDTDLSQKEVLKALKQNSSMLNTPVVVHEKGADFVDNYYQLVQKDLTFQ